MALINCPHCGKQVSDKAERCPHCGADLKKRKIRFCEECGHQIPEGSKACPNCGWPVPESKSDRIDSVQSNHSSERPTRSANTLSEAKTERNGTTEQGNSRINPAAISKQERIPDNKPTKRKHIGLIAGLLCAAIVVVVIFAIAIPKSSGRNQSEQTTQAAAEPEKEEPASPSSAPTKKPTAAPTQKAKEATSEEASSDEPAAAASTTPSAETSKDVEGQNAELTAILQDIQKTYEDFKADQDSKYQAFVQTMTESYQAGNTNEEAVTAYFIDLNAAADACFQAISDNSTKYFDTISSTIDASDYDTWDDALDDIYDAVYDGAYDDIYDAVYDGYYDDAYDDIYDGLISDAYESLSYDTWSSASSDFYKDWSDNMSDFYKSWSNALEDFYKAWSKKSEDLYKEYMG